MCVIAWYALESLVGNPEIANARVTCEQNSTAIPTVMTRLTSDRALRLTDQKNISPNMLSTIIAMTTMMMTAVHRSNPSSMNVIPNMAAMLRPRLKTVWFTIVRYCS